MNIAQAKAKLSQLVARERPPAFGRRGGSRSTVLTRDARVAAYGPVVAW
ncbi:MAG: hypothetical protein M3T55_15185 [Pseudomonadota bacterium]|nr:hypothetical protein [Pseudomonadota bacterium]